MSKYERWARRGAQQLNMLQALFLNWLRYFTIKVWELVQVCTIKFHEGNRLKQ